MIAYQSHNLMVVGLSPTVATKNFDVAEMIDAKSDTLIDRLALMV